MPEERAGHPGRPLRGWNPLCPCFLLCSPCSAHSPPSSSIGYFSRYACAPLPPDPSGLSASETSGGSAHTSSQPDLRSIHLIHNRWPVYTVSQSDLCYICLVRWACARFAQLEPWGHLPDKGLTTSAETWGSGGERLHLLL